jgi:hypothetical protein
MTRTIVVLWWVFLVAVLLITLVDVYFLLRVVRLARQIRTLSAKTLPAAVGIVEHTAVGEALDRTGPLVSALVHRADNVAQLTAVFAPRLAQEGQ